MHPSDILEKGNTSPTFWTKVKEGSAGVVLNN